MRKIRRITLAIFTVSLIISPASYATQSSAGIDTAKIVVTPQAVTLPTAPLFITSYMTDGLPVYAQIYNSSSDLVDLQDWQIGYSLKTIAGDMVTGEIPLSGYIKPASYLVIGRSNLVEGADISFDLGVDVNDFAAVQALSLNNDGYAPDIRTMSFASGTRYNLSKSDAGNYVKTSKFVAVTNPNTLPLEGGGYYTFPDVTGLRVTELLANTADCAPLDNDARCNDFVEIQNRSSEMIDLGGYRLRLGYGNVTSGIANTVVLSGGLSPGAYLAVSMRSDGKPLDLTASGGNVWLEDAYGIHTYEETIVSYPDFGATIDKGIAFALDDGDSVWKNATSPTPGAVNDFSVPDIEAGRGAIEDSASSPPKPCAANQYRNPETGRCKLLVATTSTLKPCAADQYRSVETNRCRSLIATTALATQQPCNANQYRNPDTGRCKLLASESGTKLQPCAAGQERNPDTNRCRKVAASAIPSADFPVEAVGETTKSFVGWYALGGVLLLGAGYGVFEWRQEIGRFICKTATVFSRK